ncbi:Crp/Fnr family transcriptional regulator [Ferruginibacter sp.]|uniref:Crp/Fnr family transcriptional regulator n=1 Tax=Ferruginibacter sp. TaxID=1940288 RepID=UPI00265AA1B8|nr:Crp/Fnr family transcriptional regulator [Ferruginibacter sp.]
MSVQKLIDSLQKHIHLSNTEQEMLSDFLVFKAIKKRQFLLHEGQVAKEVAFVISGCLRSYSIDPNGFEHILQFAPEGWWITDMYSFISEQEGHLNIDALMDTEVYLLSRKNQLALFDKIPALERYFRIVTENSLVSSRQRLVDSLSLTASQRYGNFCNTYPTLIHDLPQKLIASYIGVTPEFLSKLRNERSKVKIS